MRNRRKSVYDEVDSLGLNNSVKTTAEKIYEGHRAVRDVATHVGELTSERDDVDDDDDFVVTDATVEEEVTTPVEVSLLQEEPTTEQNDEPKKSKIKTKKGKVSDE